MATLAERPLPELMPLWRIVYGVVSRRRLRAEETAESQTRLTLAETTLKTAPSQEKLDRPKGCHQPKSSRSLTPLPALAVEKDAKELRQFATPAECGILDGRQNHVA